ncbi:MAG TPA: prepilin-type N-terminal cleavage/methylation domain-containing protein, partial [Tichowtungia sp.]|nr:prepilin-type N-terminal cleavage/methylation domain-containing protein [Tichowtungia sp.]
MKQIKKQGFTLVEIMIVVAIIGLLAAIGVPSIMKAYNTSQEKAKLANIKRVEDAKTTLTLPSDSVTGAAGATQQDLADYATTDLKDSGTALE